MVACYASCAVCCLLRVVGCLMFVVCSVLVVDGCFTIVVWCLLSVARCCCVLLNGRCLLCLA